MAMAEVYEVATFYHHFDVVKEGETAPPAITVRVCDSIACELAGSHDAARRSCRRCSARTSACCTRRASAAARRRRSPWSARTRCPHATAEQVVSRVQAGRRDASDTATRTSASRPDTSTTPPIARLAATRSPPRASAVERTPADVIALMEDSGLRGLGGAGFPAGRKWKLVSAEPAPRLMAINIDEGEPGTFKDRYYLERDPHRFLEGAIIAAWAVGIDAVYIYLRDEYHGCRAILEREIAALQAEPAVRAPAIPSAARRRRLHLRRRVRDDRVDRGQARRAAAASALRRAGRAVRPADARAQHGDAALGARDHREGPGWFAGHGRNGRKGLRSFSVSGRVKKPGVHLAPAGITLQELIDEYCGGMLDGHTLYGYLPGGASGGILPASMANVPLDFDTLNAVRLLHRLGGDRRAVGQGHGDRRRRAT